MKKKSSNWSHFFVLISLVIIIMYSCTKADNTPTKEATVRLTDEDGNVYKIVTIGTQVWMAENLKTTKYNDGTSIPLETDGTAWSNLTTAAYCWYNNDTVTYKATYGAIYNWYAVNSGKLCPNGWHVPTNEDYDTLELYLGIPQADIITWGWRGTNQGAQMKNKTGWASGENGTNASGFSAIPGGYRYAVSGNYNDIGNLTYFWSSTELDAARSWYRRLDGNNNGIYKAGVEKTSGKYIRCTRNN